MPFTLKTEKDNRLNFLDITIIKNKDEFKYKIYRKSTTTDTIIHTDSHRSTTKKWPPTTIALSTDYLQYLLKLTIFRKN